VGPRFGLKIAADCPLCCISLASIIGTLWSEVGTICGENLDSGFPAVPGRECVEVDKLNSLSTVVQKPSVFFLRPCFPALKPSVAGTVRDLL
jgi:hypothetical protein